MSDLMVLDLGGVALPFDQTQAAELTKNMTAGFSGNFPRSARLSMGNSGDWELVTVDGEIVDLGREVNLVIVDQREYISRMHYGKSYDDMKESGEFEAPDCKSFDGVTPDQGVAHKYADKCKDCKALELSGQSCTYYRRLVCVLAHTDGSFSEPFIFEPKAKSLFDKTVVKERYGSYGWYMMVLANQKRNGVAMPIPTQSIVTKCMPMPKMDVATVKFGVGSTPAGGYWTLTKEQFDHILKLKDSDEVKELLKPFDAAFNNPSSAGRIPVTDVTEEPVEQVVESQPEPKAKPKPVPKAKVTEPEVKPKVELVVLGLDHPDVKASTDFDYADLVEWAKEASEEEVNEFLKDYFPQALEPVEQVVESQPVPKAKPKPVPKAKVAEPEKKPQDAEPEENTSDETQVGHDLATKAAKLAAALGEFDD